MAEQDKTPRHPEVVKALAVIEKYDFTLAELIRDREFQVKAMTFLKQSDYKDARISELESSLAKTQALDELTRKLYNENLLDTANLKDELAEVRLQLEQAQQGLPSKAQVVSWLYAKKLNSLATAIHEDESEV